MKWFRHRKARNDRDAGLAFAWRVAESRPGRVAAGVVIIGLAAAAFAAVVKVRVLSPLPRSGQRGTLLLAAGNRAGIWLERRGAESTPFPAPLEVDQMEATRDALAKHPALMVSGWSGYVPQLRDLPAAPERQREPVERLGFALPPLPQLAEVPRLPAGSGGGRSRVPVLTPDSPGLAVRVPVPLPPFEVRAGEELPAEDLRFLVELAADGRVRTAVALSKPGPDPVLARIDRWLREIRFEPVAAGDGWFTLAVTFVFAGND